MTDTVRESKELGVRLRQQDDLYIVETRDFLGYWAFVESSNEEHDDCAFTSAITAYKRECHRKLDLTF